MAKFILVLLFALVTIVLSKSTTNEGLTTKTENDRQEESAQVKPMTKAEDQVESELKSGLENFDMADLMNKCNESFRIEMAYLQSLNESGSFPDETDKTPKCFMRCMLASTGVMSEGGELDAARAALVFAGERGGRPMDLGDITAACATNRQESCRCEKAYNFMRCVMSMEIDKYGSAQ